jgi:hypothetical protein
MKGQGIFYEAEEILISPFKARRKFSTKDCEECTICSDDVFEVENELLLVKCPYM